MIKWSGGDKSMLAFLRSKNGIVNLGRAVHKMGFVKTEVPMTVPVTRLGATPGFRTITGLGSVSFIFLADTPMKIRTISYMISFTSNSVFCYTLEASKI